VAAAHPARGQERQYAETNPRAEPVGEPRGAELS
jgi:hypothetical protein